MKHDDGCPGPKQRSKRTTATRAPAEARYRSYLLRCWEERAETGSDKVWRFSLEDTRTGQRRGFASLNELLAALETDLAE
jgi:hypothetical protein